jgi:hypothetical protein
MYRIDNPTASTTLPPTEPVGTPGFFTKGDSLVGQEATIVEADWMNTVQEELAYIVESGGGMTLNKTDRTQVLAALRRLFVVRVLVTADMTLYVNPTTGNDANDGRTAGTAFLTIQAAIDAVYSKYDWNGHRCNIQLAAGTYVQNTAGAWVAYFNGQPFNMPLFGLQLLGNTAAPATVILQGNSANAIGGNSCAVNLNGFTVKASGTSWTLGFVQGVGIGLNVGAWFYCANLRWDTCGMFDIRCDNGSVIAMLTGTTFAFLGSGNYGIYAGLGSLVWFPSCALTVGGWAKSIALFQSDQGRIEAGGASFSGSATGPRYLANDCGVINTNGGGPTFFPGSSAGSVLTGGQYI